MAQTVPAPIEAVIVTAQHRAQSAQTVPISMSALADGDLRARSIRSAADLAAAAPNLQYVDDGTGEPAPITIRGIGAYTHEPGIDQAAGLYVDDIFNPGNTALAALDLYDVDHAEVLRGPQGTLFGRNALAGALNITTKMPANTTSADLRVAYGNHDLRRITGIFNAPLGGDKLILNLATNATKHAGYVNDTTTHSGIDAENEFGWRLKLLARPTDHLEILLTDEHQRNDAASGAGLIAFYNKAPLLPLPAPLPRFFGTDPRIIASDPHPDPYDLTSVESPSPRQHYLEDMVGLHATLTTDIGSFTAISSYRHGDFRWTTSGGGAPVSFALATDANAYQSWSQELRWTKQFGRYVDVVSGAYVFAERSDNTPHIDVLPAYAKDFQTGLHTLDEVFGPVAGGFIGEEIAAAYPVQVGDAQANAVTKSHSYAGYVHSIGHILPVFDVTLGARYTYETRSIDFSQTTNPFLQAAQYQPVTPQSASVDSDNFSPLVTLSYHPRPSLLSYFTFSEGFKGGGYNNFYATGSTLQGAERGIVTPFRPETLRNYELGAKASFLDHRLVIDADIFNMDWYGRQLVEEVAEISGSNFQTVNCCDLNVRGAEIEATAKPLKALVLRGGYGTNYPKVARSTDPAATGIHTGDILDVAPHYSANVGMDVTALMNDRYVVTITADYYYRGHWALNEPNPRAVQGAFGLLDARVSFGPGSGAWSFALWGKNLTDTRWSAAGLNNAYAFPFIGTFEYQPAPPRIFGVGLDLHI